MPDEQSQSRASVFAVPAPQQVTINTTDVSANQISLKFDTPNGNQPSSYGNNVYIWQSGNQVPWSSDALNSQAITVNTPNGTVSFNDLNVTTLSYIIGYAVGPIDQTSWTKYPNVVASVFVPAIGNSAASADASQNGDVFQPSVNVATFGATSLVANISLPPGFNPGASDTYVGIWEGETASYNQTPKWWQPATSSNASSTVSFNNIQILRGTTYTLALFATGYSDTASSLKQTAMAATYTFQV